MPTVESAERLQQAWQEPLTLTDNRCTPAGDKRQPHMLWSSITAVLQSAAGNCSDFPSSGSLPALQNFHKRKETGEFMVRAHPRRTDNSEQPAVGRSTGLSGAIKGPHFVSEGANNVPGTTCATEQMLSIVPTTGVHWT